MGKTYKELKMNNLRVTILLLGVIFFSATPAFGFDIVTREITFEDDPVEILSTWAHLKEEKYGKELWCWVEFTNQSSKPIEALSFRMLFYDVFNRYLDTFGGIMIRKIMVEQGGRGGWKPRIYDDWSTHTIMIFLDRVRFEDGTIWIRDEADITKELSEVENILFKPEQLEEKRKK